MFRGRRLVCNLYQRLSHSNRFIPQDGFQKCPHLNIFDLKLRSLHSSLTLLGSKGIPIKMPSLSPTMMEGTIVKWMKQEGDKIQPGDVLCEVQTDKAVVGLELEEEGVLAKIIMPDDSKDIKIGTLIALMVEEGEDWKDVEMPEGTDKSLPSSETKSAKDTRVIEEKKQSSSQTLHLIGPSVRNLIHQYGIDISALAASSTGPHKTLLKSDVLQYIKTHNLMPQAITSTMDSQVKKQSTAESKTSKSHEEEYVDIELSNMRKVIAKRLTQSKTTIPHSYMSVDCNINSVIAVRKELKKSKLNVSVNDFIIKAAALSLKRVPQLNCNFEESSSSVLMSPTVDISIAVATPNGLITPIVKNANHLSVEEINKTVKELADKARAGKLQPHEFQGGSFSISNLGMFGVREFSAVINPPQSAILAIGSSRGVLDEHDGVKQLMTVTLSYDARAIEEDEAALFLETFEGILKEAHVIDKLGDGSNNRRLNALISP